MAKKIISIAVFGLVCAGMIIYFDASQYITSGISQGLSLCVTAIIPSLFPFIIVSDFLYNSGIIDKALSFFAPFARRALKLTPKMFSVFVLSLIGGFPVGAMLTEELLKRGEIERKQALRMLAFCINAGPAFIITAVGSMMLGSSAIGVMLFFSQVVAGFTVALITARGADVTAEGENANLRNKAYGNIFVSAVQKGGKSIFTICIFIVVFSAVISVIKGLIFPILPEHELGVILKPILLGVIEVTNGCREVAILRINPAVICALISFAGLSIIFQVMACTPTVKPSLKYILATRAGHAVISSAVYFVLEKITAMFGVSLCVYAPVSQVKAFAVNPSSAVVLFVLICAMILFDKDTRLV